MKTDMTPAGAMYNIIKRKEARMKKKRLWLGMLLTMLMLVLIPTTKAAAADVEAEEKKDVSNSDFNVTVEVGLDEIIFQEKSTPITVAVSNSGKDFNGLVRVIVPCSYVQEAIAYERSIVIPSGGAKSVSMLIPNISNATYLRVELVNEKGKILYSQQEKVTMIEVGNQAIIGVLSDDYTGLNYFDGVSVSTSSGIVSTRLLQLDAATFPEKAEGLSTCHYILIDNYNTSQLSEEQRNALAGWVSDGGMLILGTGSKASSVLTSLQDTLCPISIGSLGKATLDVAGGVTTEEKKADVVALSGDNWEDVSSYIARGGAAWKSTYGARGTVLILEYDLAMEPIVSMNERKLLASNILENAGNSDNYERMLQGEDEPYNEWRIQSAVNSADGNKMPNALLYAGIFLLYVLAIGPISYLILKAKDKREKMWIVIPIIAAGFTFIVFGTSMFYRIHKPFADAVSILEYNGKQLDTSTYISLQSPKAAAYTVSLEEGYGNVEAWGDSNYDYDSLGTTNYNYAIREDAGVTSIAVNKGQPFTSYNLLAKKNELLQTEGFALNLHCSVSTIEGEVTNQTGYDLKNAVICYNGVYCFLGAFKNGETKQIKSTDNHDVSNVSYNLEEWMEKTPSDYWFFGSDSENKKLQQNKELYTVLKWNQYGLQMNQGMVFGMIEQEADALITDNAAKVYSIRAAVTYFTQRPEEYQNYSTFIDDINRYMVGGEEIPYDKEIYPEQYDCFLDTDRYMYGADEMIILYDFSTVDLNGAVLYIKEEQNVDEYMDTYSDDSSEVEVWIYNNDTQNYEQLFVYWEEEVIQSSYVDENGWVRIKYVADTSGSCWAPEISLIGGEK